MCKEKINEENTVKIGFWWIKKYISETEVPLVKSKNHTNTPTHTKWSGDERKQTFKSEYKKKMIEEETNGEPEKTKKLIFFTRNEYKKDRQSAVVRLK